MRETRTRQEFHMGILPPQVSLKLSCDFTVLSFINLQVIDMRLEINRALSLAASSYTEQCNSMAGCKLYKLSSSLNQVTGDACLFACFCP